MNVWIVNPFDPLPGDPEQEGRYATLARMLRNAGHGVVWWTSSFSHRFKKPVEQKPVKAACDEIGVDVRFLDSPAYSKNVSVRRLWNHYVLAKNFRRAVKNDTKKPDVVLASAPPPLLAKSACRFAKAHGIACVVDVQDLWPETFYRLMPAPLQWLAKTLLAYWAAASRKAYRLADAIVGVADEYVDHAVAAGGEKRITATIPLGVDLAAFKAAAEAGRCEQYTRPEDEVWLAYTGSLNRSYDPLTIIKAVAKLRGRTGRKFRLFITGRGELQGRAEQIIHEENLDNVTLTGFLDFPAWACLLSQCNVGFNASFPEARIFLPNKIFYYFAAALAVLNTIPGQCSRIVSDGKAGMDYTAGDVDGCAEAIAKMLDDDSFRLAAGEASGRLARTTYDRRILYAEFVKLLEKLAAQ